MLITCNVLQEFLVDVSSPFLRDAHFTLEKPLVATRIRFLINGAVPDPSGRLCWEVTLFGCPLSEGEEHPANTHMLDTVFDQYVNRAEYHVPAGGFGRFLDHKHIPCLAC